MIGKSEITGLLFAAVALCGASGRGTCATPDSIAIVVRSPETGAGHKIPRFRKIPAGGAVCIHPVQNLSGKVFDITGLNDELAAQIVQFGYRAGSSSVLGTCDATVYTEIVEIRGHQRPRVGVDFRVVLADEQVPRLCTRVTGRSFGPVASFANSLVPTQTKDAAVERGAIVAAFAEQALKIESAQVGGMELYSGVER